MSATHPAILHLSLILGGELRDAAGHRLGRIDDLVVRLGNDEYPPVSGIVASVAGRDVYVPAERVTELEHRYATVSASRLDIQPFRRREGEVLLKEDLLDRQLINVDGARLVKANEIEIARVEGWWRVVGIDTGPRSLLRRLLPRRLAERIDVATFLDWASLEPFTGHIPTIRLRVPHPKLARLHAAELADLVEAAPRSQGEEIIAAVHDNPDLEADVFEELADDQQLELLEERSDTDIAELLARMETDDAADLIAQLDDEHRGRVLDLLPSVQQRRLRTLLGYEPMTAGGLMSPEIVTVYTQAVQAEAIDRIRRAAAPSEALAWIFVVNVHRRYRGAVSLVDLVRAEPDTPITDLVTHQRAVKPGAELEQVARTMTDYDLTVIPVLDDQDRPIGVVTVDDILELLAPPPGRRFGPFGGT